MTTELTVSSGEWLALKASIGILPKPFERSVDLGEYKVEGLIHSDNPVLKFRKIKDGEGLQLRVGMDGSCEIVMDGDAFGWLPKREGDIFNRLLKSGKRLIATPTHVSADGLEPTMSVSVRMEEF